MGDVPGRVAGGRIDFHAPLRFGEHATRRSRIATVEEKTGRSGRLVFVTLEHVISAGGAPRLTETQTVVYRAAPEPGAAAPEGPEIEERAEFSREVDPDTVLLFRYSALIFFGHRIHYDLPYTREVEGHPDLLVHGPLTATLLTDLGLTRLEGRRLTGLSIRALQPLYAGRPFTLEGRESGGGLRLWARSPGGRAAMRVDLELSE